MKIIIENLKEPDAIVYGYYDIETNEIHINKRLKIRKKIQVFIHEYLHYLVTKFHRGNDLNFLIDFITILIIKKHKRINIINTFNYYYDRSKYD